MAKLYYGNGTCSIEGSDIAGVEIQYRGNIEIDDKTSPSFAIASGDSKIIIFPISIGVLNELFDYRGTIKIISVLVADKMGNSVSTTIHKVMDYSELLNSKSEDMTILSEDLKAGYTSGSRIKKTTLKVKIIPNLHTSNFTTLYLSDGIIYTGDMHIHLEGGAMTGSSHTDESQHLYYKRVNSAKLIATKRRIRKAKRKKKSSSRVTSRSSY